MIAEAMIALEATYYSASLIKLGEAFYQRFKRAPTPDEGATMKVEAKESAAKALNLLPPEATLNSTTIVLLKKIDATRADMDRAIGGPNQLEFNSLFEAAVLRRQMCLLISETEKYNAGKIPAVLMSVWNEDCCKSDGSPMFDFKRSGLV